MTVAAPANHSASRRGDWRGEGWPPREATGRRSRVTADWDLRLMGVSILASGSRQKRAQASESYAGRGSTGDKWRGMLQLSLTNGSYVSRQVRRAVSERMEPGTRIELVAC